MHVHVIYMTRGGTYGQHHDIYTSAQYDGSKCCAWEVRHLQGYTCMTSAEQVLTTQLPRRQQRNPNMSISFWKMLITVAGLPVEVFCWVFCRVVFLRLWLPGLGALNF